MVRLGSRDCLIAALLIMPEARGKSDLILGRPIPSWFSGSAMHEDLAPTKCDLQWYVMKALGAWGGDLNNIFCDGVGRPLGDFY